MSYKYISYGRLFTNTSRSDNVNSQPNIECPNRVSWTYHKLKSTDILSQQNRAFHGKLFYKNNFPSSALTQQCIVRPQLFQSTSTHMGQRKKILYVFCISFNILFYFLNRHLEYRKIIFHIGSNMLWCSINIKQALQN